MGFVISTVNMKGGVGKTTLTVNLATSLAKDHNKRVLVLDLDAQISATLSLMSPHDFAKIRRERRTLSYLIDKVVRPDGRKKRDIRDLIVSNVCEIPTLELLPGDIEIYDEYIVSEMLHQQALEQEETEFNKVWNHFEQVLLRSILEPVVNEYDFIIMDCAPGYNLLTRSGIVASDFYLLPARPEPLSLVGIQLLERRIKKLKETHREPIPLNIDLLGIVFILSSGGFMGRYYRQVMQRVSQDFLPEQVFDEKIPMDVNVAKAVDTFTPAVVATPNSSGSRAFAKLTTEFLQKVEATKNRQQQERVAV
jgi:chromosome partitioning protein